MPGPLPSTPFEVDITHDDVEFFREHGYLAVDQLVPDDELAWLRTVYDEVFAARSGGFPMGAFDLTRRYDEDPDAGAGRRFTQVLFPENTEPQLRATACVRNARRIASRLLEVQEGELTNWGHMLTKPASVGFAAPWHQDEAYWDPAHQYQAVGAWVPLDDATVDNGCLWFIPGSHTGPVLAHRHHGDDPAVHLLEVVEPVDTSTAVAVPLKAGGASFHHSRTLHFSRPNTTDHDRRAYANEFQTAPVRRAVPADRPWWQAGMDAFEEISAGTS